MANFFWPIGDRINGVPLYMFSVNEFLFFFKEHYDAANVWLFSKRLLFSRSWNYIGINNVLAYVKSFNNHTNIIVFYDDYTFVLMTKLLTLMAIYIAEIKGKRCSSTGGKNSKENITKENLTEARLFTTIIFISVTTFSLFPFPLFPYLSCSRFSTWHAG